MTLVWKKGRGKLGLFKPLLGAWIVTNDSSLGQVVCRRRFAPILGGKFIQLEANWKIGTSGKSYDELAVFGPGPEKTLCFWSYTSDGKRSEGWQSEAPEIHPQAICFEADMDMGRARQVFYPGQKDGWHWLVEHRVKKGWSRLVDHHYLPETGQ
ncbi:MAG: hypothetical protein GXP01_05575 [Alphaproteobacteria bacterium]|nr:hypothetical protein [Alphaproteobacteria bacterium]